MKQMSNGNSTRESYYDYMSRMMREEDQRLGIDHRSADTKIKELTDRVKQLEVDMAHAVRKLEGLLNEH